MRKLSYLLIGMLVLTMPACNDNEQHVEESPVVPEQGDTLVVQAADMLIRSPFIIVNRDRNVYNLMESRMTNGKGALYVYESTDLKTWTGKGYVFKPGDKYFANKGFSAPKTYLYKGAYYCFVTAGGDNVASGVTILKGGADPTEAFTPHLKDNQQVVTPAEMAATDGSLYVDGDGTPWLIFARQFERGGAGEVYAMKLSEELDAAADTPIRLVTAAGVRWVAPLDAEGKQMPVSAPSVYKDPATGSLILLWSGYSTGGKYAIGQSVSDNGKIDGNWTSEREPIFFSDGGSAMVFEDLQGHTKIAYHAPDAREPRMQIESFTVQDGKIARFDTNDYVAPPRTSVELNVKEFEVIYANIPAEESWMKFSQIFDGNAGTYWSSKYYYPSSVTCGNIWCSGHTHPLSDYTFPDYAILPPYIFIIDMKQPYTITSVETLGRYKAGDNSTNYWCQKIKKYAYYISNDELPEDPQEADFKAEKGWNKLGEADNVPTVMEEYSVIRSTDEFNGRYLKLVVLDMYMMHRGPEVDDMHKGSNPNVGYVSLSEIHAQGYSED